MDTDKIIQDLNRRFVPPPLCRNFISEDKKTEKFFAKERQAPQGGLL